MRRYARRRSRGYHRRRRSQRHGCIPAPVAGAQCDRGARRTFDGLGCRNRKPRDRRARWGSPRVWRTRPALCVGSAVQQPGRIRAAQQRRTTYGNIDCRHRTGGTGRTPARNEGMSRSVGSPWLWVGPPETGRLPVPCDEGFVESPALGLRPKARATNSGLHAFGHVIHIASRARGRILGRGAQPGVTRSLELVDPWDWTCHAGLATSWPLDAAIRSRAAGMSQRWSPGHR